MVLVLAIFLLAARSGFACNFGSYSVIKAFRDNQLVPDVVSYPPTRFVQVVYNENTSVCLGNYLPVPQVALQPRYVSWPAAYNRFFTLAMVDPDAPSRTTPILRELKHWLVVNIPGVQVQNGTVLASYLSPTPTPVLGPHRYTFLVYLQPGRVQFNTTILTSEASRANFSIRKFAANYNMTLYAGNFYFAEILSAK